MGPMNTWLHTIKQFIEGTTAPGPVSPKVVVSRQYIRTSARSGSRMVVQRNPLPYWKERGWQKKGDTYRGSYRTPFGQWPGRVTLSPAGRVEVFIRNPPPVLEDHPHWICFNKRTGGWYFVHPSERVADVSAGILGLEKTIMEAYAS
jgi:hypothetical protein